MAPTAPTCGPRRGARRRRTACFPEAGIWVQAIDGSGNARRLRPTLAPGIGSPNYAVMAPDRRTVVFVTYAGTQGRDIHTFTDGTSDTTRAWLATKFDEFNPRVSPDGKWIAYSSNESGRLEVSVRPFTEGGPRVQISSAGGADPVWSRDGNRLYYQSSAQLMAADLGTVPTLSVRARRTVMSFGSAQATRGAGYDVARDGSVLYPESAGGGTKLVVVVNWLAEARQKLRAGRN